MKNNFKISKGFTLVELAIVLVVIGLLLGMAFKGKSLVDAARLKSDLNKVQKISTAINVYYAKFESFPKDAAGNITERTIYDGLLKEGLLAAEDFRMRTTKLFYHIIPCEEATTGGGATVGDKFWKPSASYSDNAGMCVSTDATDPSTNSSLAWENMQISSELLCYFESIMDDSNPYGGDGRRLQRASQREPEVRDCAKAKDNDENGGPKYAYYFRIF